MGYGQMYIPKGQWMPKVIIFYKPHNIQYTNVLFFHVLFDLFCLQAPQIVTFKRARVFLYWLNGRKKFDRFYPFLIFKRINKHKNIKTSRCNKLNAL